MKKEIIVTILLLVLSTLFFNPYVMPQGYISTVLVGFIIVLGVFVGLFWKEKGGDERDRFLVYMSDRVAYFVGVSVLALGIIVEIYKDMHADAWLLAGFVVMVVGKMIGLVYANRRH